MRAVLVAGLAVVATTSCTTMQLSRYPEASPNAFGKSTPKNGVSVVAQPLLDKELTKKYFGVDLIDKKTLAVHLTIRNENPSVSYTVRAENIAITSQINANTTGRPSAGSQDVGEAIGVAGAVLLSPLLLAVAVQQLSNASIIEENFEAKRLRTRTIDPGQQAGGFAYFNWEQVKTLQVPELCVELMDTATRAALPYCVGLSLGGSPR